MNGTPLREGSITTCEPTSFALLFEALPTVLRNRRPDLGRGSTSSPPLRWEGLQEVTPCMRPTPGMSEWESAGSDGKRGSVWLADRQKQCPSSAYFIPPGSELQGSASGSWEEIHSSKEWLGRGGEENVVLIQLWNTTCDFERTEKNINSDAKANFQMAHQNSFFLSFILLTSQGRYIL